MTKPKIKKIALYRILIVAIMITVISIVNGNASENQKGYMDPMAIEVLENVSEFLSDAKTLSMKATALNDHVMESGVIVTYAKEVEVYVKRPDKFLAIIRGDNLKQRRIYFDGKYFVRLNVEKKYLSKISL